MNFVFADAGYWIALLSPRDRLHEKAKAVSARLAPLRILTSEMVLVEVLNGFSRSGPVVREAAAAFAGKIVANPNVEVLPQTSLLFQAALRLYLARKDKEWGLTDCASITIMQDRGLTQALSHDRHFQQAGFVALLSDD